jgi:hypothetical protein
VAGTQYRRRDLVIRLGPTADGACAIDIVDGEHRVGYAVPGPVVSGLTPQTPVPQIAAALWSAPPLQAEWTRWRLAGGAAASPDCLNRLCLCIDDNRLAALPLEPALAEALLPPTALIVRLVAVPPRVAQVRFTLPLRLLQLDRRGDFDLPDVVREVFRRFTGGRLDSGRLPAAAIRVKADRAARFAGWSLPAGWKTVDVLHLDQLPAMPERLRLAMAAPQTPGTLGWLQRCIDLWRTRLVVIRGGSELDPPTARRLAHRLAALGGPAVLLVDPAATDIPDRLQGFYDKLIHDSPIDVAAALAVACRPALGTLVVGAGREERLRVSAPGDDFASLASDLLDSDLETRATVAGRLWSAVAASHRNTREAAATFTKTLLGIADIAAAMLRLNFDIHEGDGLVPLGDAINRLRQATRTKAVPPTALRPAADPTAPRFANIGLWRLDPADGRQESIAQPAARLTLAEPIVLGVQLGPRTGYAPVLDAVALIEEPFKWAEGQEGVWLSVGITGLDFAVTSAALQQVWLPRGEASDLVEFVVAPNRTGISQLRLCLYYGADLLQSHRLAAIVDGASPAAETGAGGGSPQALAAALGVAAERVGNAGWLARMEYAATADLAHPPADRDVALSIFANDLGGRRVFTMRGTEGYEVMLAGDTGDLASDIRTELDGVSRDANGVYAFLGRDGLPLHGAPPVQRDAALQRLAHRGWSLDAAIFKGADRAAMAADLAGDGRVIHVAHSLLENVIPWAAIYDRPYDIDRQQDDAGLPVLRATCPAGLPDASGKFPAAECATHPTCPLSPQGRAAAADAGQGVAEDTIVCARHFWGFRHIVELPPYQEDGDAAPAPGDAAGSPAAPARRVATAAGKPVSLLLGYNAGLGTAAAHCAELQALLNQCKLAAVWQQENSRDRFLTALRSGEADLVYLFCHARGGLADPGVRPPVLELQEETGLIRAAALADGLRLAHHPLVILNDCNTAAFSPDALSPFIRTLVRDGEAAGALGTEIPVFELLAGDVARRFLIRFLGGESAGAALLNLRRDLLAVGNPLGLAYTLYAVAELKLVQQ